MQYSVEFVKAFLEEFGSQFNATDNPKLLLYFDGHETDNLTPEDYQTIELKLMPKEAPRESVVLNAKITYLKSKLTENDVAEPYLHEDNYFIPIVDILEIKLEKAELDLSRID